MWYLAYGEHLVRSQTEGTAMSFAPLFPLVLAAALTLCCASSSLRAIELDDAILRLGAEDYDEREAATEYLGSMSAGYARLFLKLASSISDPEIRDRLNAAAKMIFERQIGAKDERWLRLHGSLGISYHVHYLEKISEGGKDREALGMAVSWVDENGPSDNRLQTWDVITEINGVKLGARDIDQLVKPGTQYELTVRRYTNSTLIAERDNVSSDETGYHEFKVSVTAGWREAHQVDQDSAQAIMTVLWREFLDEYQNSRGRYAALRR